MTHKAWLGIASTALPDGLSLRLAQKEYEISGLGRSAAREIRENLEKRIRGCADPRAFGKPLRGELHGFWRYRVPNWWLL